VNVKKWRIWPVIEMKVYIGIDMANDKFGTGEIFGLKITG